MKRRAWNSTLPAPSKPPTRSAPPARTGRIKRKTRKASATERAHGSPARRKWMKRQPCVICGRTPSDAAHLKSGGIGRKDDVAFTVPLCSDDVPSGYRGHHSEYDAGKQSFRAKYAVDLEAAAAATDAAARQQGVA